MLNEKTFETDVVKINYAEGPDSGPPLILLHGGGDRWQQFLPILPHLILRWQVFAVDMRGHGKSGRVPDQYRPDQIVEDILVFLEQQLNEPGVLLGCSLGGWIALLAAVGNKDKVSALILGDPPLNLDRFLAHEGSPERVAMWQRLRELAGSGLSVQEMVSALTGSAFSGDMLAWAKSLSEVDPDVAAYHAEERLDAYVEYLDLEGALREVSCPVLLIQGDPALGGYVADEDVEQIQRLIPDSVHVRLNEIGHNLGLDTWEVGPLLKAITEFLESR
jgi:pimeloyl-ACP methyl ester carboxylesterase